MASIYCPPMPILREGIGLFLTAREPCILTLDDGTTREVVIPETYVRGRFPHQVVDECVGVGEGVIWNLPQEPVTWGVAEPIETTGTVDGIPFTCSLPQAKTTWHGIGLFVAEEVTAEIIFQE